MFLGRELMTRMGTLDDSAMERATREVMGRLNPSSRTSRRPVHVTVGRSAPVGAIARAVHFNAAS